MTFQQAIQTELIAAIVARCSVSQERAAAELKAAAKAAKATGLPLADTLKMLGLV
jgi:hypothetical protein